MDSNNMIPNGFGFYHKGFYICKDVESELQKVLNDKSFDDDDSLEAAYDVARVFLAGSCDVFSIALNHELGLPAYKIYDENGVFLHAFCLSEYNGKPAFIDVRGVTTDEMEFRTHLTTVQLDKEYLIVPQDVESEFIAFEKHEKVGYEFAVEIIRKHQNYYTI